MTKGDLERELISAINGTYYFKTGAASSSVKISSTALSQVETTENIISACAEVVKKVITAASISSPNEIVSIHIKTKNSIALPIFLESIAT